NLCVAGGAKTTQAVSELTGKAAAASLPRMSFRRCAKTEGVMKQRFIYGGVASCSAAAHMDGGSDQCAYSCLGLGDCRRGCPFDAIAIKEGTAAIIVDQCVACGKCIPICPRNVLQLVPLEHRVMIFCGTCNKGKTAMDSCSVGCINCNACIRKCPAEAVAARDGRIEIDHAQCMGHGPDCAEACVDACPRGILRPTCPETIERKQVEKQEAAARKAAEAAAKKAAQAEAGA
ncbi:MAG: Fe-S cluster domain-containing protein, partial [Deltaproteobacteria bacterium]|nr:Fe-S cluster domain-containing protein [Deltaproteobacteria bacterium]